MRIATAVTLTLSLALTACNHVNPYVDVRTDVASSPIKQERWYFEKDMKYSCYEQNGWFTHDKKACFVQAKTDCIYIRLYNDAGHNKELTAMCNGWRVAPIIRFW